MADQLTAFYNEMTISVMYNSGFTYFDLNKAFDMVSFSIREFNFRHSVRG